MGFLLLGRYANQEIELEPAPGCSAQELLEALQKKPLVVRVMRIDEREVGLAVIAPPCVSVRRAELAKRK